MSTIRKFTASAVIQDGSLGERQIRVIASDATPDRVKDVMSPNGCKLDNYNKNPIVLADHDPSKPIGRSTVQIKNGRVEAVIDFAPAGISAKADEYCGLAKAGMLNAVSVGFNPISEEPIKGGGYLYKEWELMELSVVAVPANPSALIVGRSMPGPSAKSAEAWKCGASTSLPLDNKDSWDGPAAEARIFEKAGFDGERPDAAWARKAFLAYDSANPKLKGSYKLPFADVVDGHLVAVKGGIRAAASRLPQADIGGAEEKARAALDRYEKRFKDEEDGKAGSPLAQKSAPRIKGLYDVACLAYVLEQLNGCLYAANVETALEQDASTVPAMLAEALRATADAFLAMSAEEVAELLVGDGTNIDPDGDGDDSLSATTKAALAVFAMAKRHVAGATKAGRAISDENAKCLAAAVTSMDAAMTHVKAARDHVNSVASLAKPSAADAMGDGDNNPADTELSYEAGRRKRAVAILALKDPS